MARIKWTIKSKLLNKALGLPGPDISYVRPGHELDVDAKTLRAIEERYGADAFEVLSDDDGDKKPPKKSAKAGREK